MRLSRRNMLIGGGAVGAVFAVLVGLPMLFVGWAAALAAGAAAGFFAGALAALWYGGLDLVLHYMLRALLVLQHYVPRPLAAFLNYSAELVLLRRVGGTYLFRDRFLQAHFAVRDQGPPDIMPAHTKKEQASDSAVLNDVPQ
jgi:hypothetical protein